MLAAAALIAAPGAKAAAGDFPGRPIKLIVSGGAGSYPDKLGRRIAERFTADMGQQVNVFNMPGTGIGMTALTRSEPDGHTIALATMAQMVFAPYLYRKLPYDPLKDCIPLGTVMTGPMVVVAHPSARVNTLQELLAAANSGKIDTRFGHCRNGQRALAQFAGHAHTRRSRVPRRPGNGLDRPGGAGWNAATYRQTLE